MSPSSFAQAAFDPTGADQRVYDYLDCFMTSVINVCGDDRE
jgi:hypothetical protein